MTLDQIGAFFTMIWSYLYTPVPVTSTLIEIPVPVEYTATIVGAISGTLYAAEKKFDLLGAFTLAIATGLGGGIIRDILLQSHGIYAFQSPMIIVSVIIATIAVFYFSSLFKGKYMNSVLFLLDAVAVALFAFLGSDKGMQAGLTFIPVVILGFITAVGGGALRDIISREVPAIFQRGNFYGVAALVGALVYALCSFGHINKWFGFVLCIIVVLALRYLSVIFDWRTNTAHDLTPAIKSGLKWTVRQIFVRSGDETAHKTAVTAKMEALRKKQAGTEVEGIVIKEEKTETQEIEDLLDTLAADPFSEDARHA